MTNFKLTTAFTFWVQEIDTVKAELYSNSLKEVATIEDIKEFWELFQFLKKTNDLPSISIIIRLRYVSLQRRS